jgi:hypothetical protein
VVFDGGAVPPSLRLRRTGSSQFLGEVKASKYSVIFDSSFIVSACGVDFGIESAEAYTFSVNFDSGRPVVPTFFIINTFESGRGLCFGFSFVAGILGRRCESQISPTIIEGIAVNMVNEQPFRVACEQPVHKDGLSPIVFVFFGVADCITTRLCILATPAESTKPLEIRLINDCEFAFG